jgi:signal transduction histidine kinase
MVEDDDRGLWLNTSCGLVRIVRQDLDSWSADQKAQAHPTVFGALDGMHVSVLTLGYSRRAARSKDGQLWFPTADGVAVVDPRQLPHNRVPPPVEIESIAVDEARRAIEKGLRLPHIGRTIEIDYAAFSFVDPSQVRFKYQLEGYDAAWVDAGTRRQALYPSLSPGKYRFRVIAANNDGVWNEAGAALEFSVAPTIYQTVWFRGLLAALIAGLVWLAYQLRVRHLEARLRHGFEERLRERTRISRELHDSLLQNVSALALELDALSKVVTAPMSARDHLRELRREAEVWLREARDMVGGLRAQSPDEDLSAAIERMGERLTAGKSADFQLRTSGSRRAVADRTRQHLLKIFEEAVRNAVSHAKASEIGVLLSYEDPGRLRLEICDDGCGFSLADARQKRGRFGLTTMHERAGEIQAELHIESSPGTGTRIEIRVPTIISEPVSDDRQAHSNPYRG